MQIIIKRVFLVLGILLGFPAALGQQTANTIIPGEQIVDGESLISSRGTFKLGFFSPASSTARYLGIWYNNIPVQTVVWVANRQTPITSNNGTLNLTTDGNLVLFGDNRTMIWSTNTNSLVSPFLQLWDTGNLVLSEGSSNKLLWQSFDYPGDTFLPGMKIGVNYTTNITTYLTSWITDTNPSLGEYYWKMETRGVPEAFIQSNSSKVFRTGPWKGHGWNGRPDMSNSDVFHFDYYSNHDGIYYMFETANTSLISRAVMNGSGVFQRYLWSETSSAWNIFWVVPEGPCDRYAYCGANGLCTPTYAQLCDCLEGFVPKKTTNWDLRQFQDGCVRKTPLDCKTDGFMALQNMKFPDTLNASVDSTKTLEECKEWCLNDCSCMAYAVLDVIGCQKWPGDMVDVRVFTDGGDTLYIRLAASDLDIAGSSRSKKHMWIIVIPVVLGFSLLILAGVLCRYYKKTTGDSVNVHDLPVYDLATIRYATNNFSSDNKLGQGSFGVVYRGVLKDGQEIAVKKLSKYCLQGPEEFKTELLVINRLQHRNLVRLLGCCIENEERILIYEHMQNKSLDTFIFDKRKGALLNWDERIRIILGIAKGLLYLQEGSRLLIIHRDLKPSNILLDKELTPKISDFGLARIVEGDLCVQEPTRVIGTVGYMSPEYAMRGIFSFQSDVYSFGIIVLEILSGRRNNSARSGELNLLGQAWELWNEGNELELLDETVLGSYHESEISRYIQIALLCGQDQVNNRPTMEMVYKMLSNNTMELPYPERPSLSVSAPAMAKDLSSTNEITMTIEGR